MPTGRVSCRNLGTLRTILATLALGFSVWWCIGSLPKRAVPPVPSGHWLAAYVRNDQTIDLVAAQRDQRGEAGDPQENLAALLVGFLGPSAISPAPTPALLAALGATGAAQAGLELPDDPPFRPGDLERIIADALAGRPVPPRPATFADELKVTATKPWHDQDHPTVAAWLDRQQGVLAAVLACRPTRCRIPWMPGQMPGIAPVLCFLPINTLGRACAAEAFRAMARGDSTSAVRYAAALRRMGAAAAGQGSLVDAFIGAALVSQACEVMATICDQPDMGEDALRPWREADAAVPWAPDLAGIIDANERVLCLHAVDVIFSDTNLGEETLVRRRITDVFDRAVAIAALADWGAQRRSFTQFVATDLSCVTENDSGLVRLMASGPLVRRRITTAAVGDMALGTTFPSIVETSATLRRTTARLLLIRAALALREDPPSVTLPDDPFGQGPLHLQWDAHGLRLWSVGRDGIDQQGTADDLVLHVSGIAP